MKKATRDYKTIIVQTKTYFDIEDIETILYVRPNCEDLTEREAVRAELERFVIDAVAAILSEYYDRAEQKRAREGEDFSDEWLAARP